MLLRRIKELSTSIDKLQEPYLLYNNKKVK
jgi:hypothetical protein